MFNARITYFRHHNFINIDGEDSRYNDIQLSSQVTDIYYIHEATGNNDKNDENFIYKITSRRINKLTST